MAGMLPIRSMDLIHKSGGVVCPRRRPVGCAAAVLGLLGCVAMPVHAAADDTAAPPRTLEAKAVVGEVGPAKVNLDYAIYVGGIESLRAEMRLDRDGDAYRVDLDVVTAGMVKRFLEWSMRSYAKGRIEEGQVAPAEAGRVSQWRGEDRRVRMRFADGIPIVLEAVPEIKPDQKKALLGADLSGAKDAVSALLHALMVVATTGECDTEARIFDGKRLVFVRMDNANRTKLRATRYSSYAGPAISCRLQQVRKEGAETEQSSDFTSSEGASPSMTARRWGGDDQSARAWLARVFPDSIPVPVRIEVESPLGVILGHLRRAAITRDGTTRVIGPDS